MASLGRSANVSQMEAKRAERRVSGNTVPAATRAAQSVCVCREHPLLGIKVCCQRLLSYYLLSACLVGRSHQLTEVMGNAQVGKGVHIAYRTRVLKVESLEDLRRAVCLAAEVLLRQVAAVQGGESNPSTNSIRDF